MNLYLHPVWSKWIRSAHHGGAQALRNLALHLYNSRDWPVNLGYICSLSEDHWEAALAMIQDYRGNGETNGELMALCEEIVERRLAQAETTEAQVSRSAAFAGRAAQQFRQLP